MFHHNYGCKMKKKLTLFLVSGKHSTTNRFSALLMEQPMAARKSLPQRQMEQRTGDVKVDTAGVMTTRHLSFSRYCNCTIVSIAGSPDALTLPTTKSDNYSPDNYSQRVASWIIQRFFETLKKQACKQKTVLLEEWLSTNQINVTTKLYSAI